jgi:putative MATE family efflux protein
MKIMKIERKVIKSLLVLATPIILANILQAAYQLTDAFWVGRLGSTAVASVSVSFPIIFLIISLGIGLAVAGSTFVAQYYGAKRSDMVNHSAAQTTIMVIISSIILGALGYVLSPTLINLMGVEQDVFVGALDFMRISFVGIIFVFGFAMYQSIMRGVGQVMVPMFIVLGTVLLNFVLDPLFIFGFGDIPGHGVVGAALATLTTQGIAFLIGFYLLFSGKHIIHLKWKDFKPDFSFIKKTIKLGLPSSIEQSARSLGLIFMTFLITSFGTVAIASYGVGSNILQFVFIPAMGLSMAISALVGQNIGARDIKQATQVAELGIVIAFVALTVIGLLSFVFAPELVSFFIPDDPTVIEMGSMFVRIMALTFGFVGVQLAIIGVFRGSGNMVTTMIISLISQWIFQLPIAYVLSKYTSLGIDGLWWSFPISNVLMAIVSMLIYLRGSWKKKRITEDIKLQEKVFEDVAIEERV